MPEQQILHTKFLCQLGGLLHRAVTFFIRLENVSLSVQAESLMKQVVRLQRILPAVFLTRFIAAECEPLPVVSSSHKAELSGFCGPYIKKMYVVIQNLPLFPVLDLMNPYAMIK